MPKVPMPDSSKKQYTGLHTEWCSTSHYRLPVPHPTHPVLWRPEHSNAWQERKKFMTQAILPPTLLAGVVLIVLATIGLGMRNPVLLLLGLRNTMRRPTQSLIIIAGLVLSTGLITTFVALPESLNASTVADRLVRAGQVDESVTGPLTQDQITQALASLGRVSQVQAAAAASLQRATVTSERTQVSFGNQSSDDLYLLAVPPAFDQVYGPIADTQGHALRFAGLRPGDVLVSSTLAQRFDVRPGDQIQIKQQGLEGTFPGTVRAVLSHDLVLTSAELAANDPPIYWQTIQA
jgi:putative ABC transport system permease protein